jgi:hypothetical protein
MPRLFNTSPKTTAKTKMASRLTRAITQPMRRKKRPRVARQCGCTGGQDSFSGHHLGFL